MALADQLTQLKADFDEVYGAGKQAEYDKFWDALQKNGTRKTHHSTFREWDDVAFNPKYPIICSGANNATNTFYFAKITDTKVDISLNNTTATSFFGVADKLKTIRKLIITNTVKFSASFNSCAALENLTIEGVLATNGLNVQWSTNLTHDSLMSIINALEDKSADTSGTTWEITLGDTNYAKLTAEEINIAENKGWVIG